MLFSWSRLKSLKEQFPLIPAYKPLNQWGIVFVFYFLMQEKSSRKILWLALSSELINPGWDPMDSTGYSLPNEQHKSRLSVMLHLDCRSQHTLQSWYLSCSDLGPAHFTTFLVHIPVFFPKKTMYIWDRCSIRSCTESVVAVVHVQTLQPGGARS